MQSKAPGSQRRSCRRFSNVQIMQPFHGTLRSQFATRLRGEIGHIIPLHNNREQLNLTPSLRLVSACRAEDAAGARAVCPCPTGPLVLVARPGGARASGASGGLGLLRKAAAGGSHARWLARAPRTIGLRQPGAQWQQAVLITAQ